MKSTLKAILTEALGLVPSTTPIERRFPNKFRFDPRGTLAYELVLDASGSMLAEDYPPSRFDAAKKASLSFLHRCVKQTSTAKVGVIFYAEEALIASPLRPAKTHLYQLEGAIKMGQIGPSTNIAAGLLAAGKELMAEGAHLSPVILLLTDGHSNIGSDPVEASTQLKDCGVRIDIIGIGGSPNDVNEIELKQMASVVEGRSRYSFIRDATALIQKFEALALGKL